IQSNMEFYLVAWGRVECWERSSCLSCGVGSPPIRLLLVGPSYLRLQPRRWSKPAILDCCVSSCSVAELVGFTYGVLYCNDPERRALVGQSAGYGAVSPNFSGRHGDRRHRLGSSNGACRNHYGALERSVGTDNKSGRYSALSPQ